MQYPGLFTHRMRALIFQVSLNYFTNFALEGQVFWYTRTIKGLSYVHLAIQVLFHMEGALTLKVPC